MKIQVWSDFRCPFCYIGKKHLEEAIQKSGRDVQIEMMSFELDPDHTPSAHESMAEHLAHKYGISVAEAEENNARVVSMAKSAGLNYDFDRLIDVNTFVAHKVFQLAKLKGVGNEFVEVAMSGHFESGKDLSDLETLIAMGESVGLERIAIENAVNSDDFAISVRQEEQFAQMVGAKGVPHFVFDNKVSLSGAQPVDTFMQAMDYVDNLEPTVEAMDTSNNDDVSCTDGSCTI
ncbi:DsbA family oxidoreductase [Erysipelothrix sp. HDW6B]|uniref:DsbA family oxidoreductase n=1 Tax=Erysipelothrix TaxID=1647 RepID=UPI00135CD16E|nr:MULTISPECIES: DsbA family oxidoreductase [Erysipelothrix]QIK85437.1 DsbA family oxidoreductase [Erysipelothrix sp. HDW6B]